MLLLLLQGWFYSASLYAQSNPNSATAGKEFKVTYLHQTYGAATLQLKVVVEKACYITAKYNYDKSTYWNNWNNTLIQPGIYTENVSYDDVVSVGSGTTYRTIAITSTEDICVYAINYLNATSDATCILPVPVWGTEYRLATGVPIQESQLFYPSAYAVVAKQNNTSVTLHNSNTITLNENQVYHFYSTASLDLTGEKVTSTSPIALFSGSTATYGPGGNYGCMGLGGGSADHTYEQLWSVDKWGKEFFAFPILTPGGNANWGGMLALVADENGTNITLSGGINGGTSVNYTLNAGEKKYVCYVMSGLTKISSNKSIMVFLILPDATVTNIVPTDQRIQHAIVAPFILTGNTNINQHGIDMLIPVASWNQTVIKENGTIVSNTTYTVNSSAHFPEWYHIRKNLPNVDVAIDITCSGGFLAYISGNGNAESYAFMAGTGAFDLQNYFTIQEKGTTIDTYYENTTELTHTFETSDIMVVKRTVEKSFTAISWLINGVQYPITENLSSMKTLNFPASALIRGENSLTMSVRYSGATQDSLYTGKVWLSCFCGGNGTQANPYQICTAEELACLANMVNNGNDASFDKYYILMNDIDLSIYAAGSGWVPIGKYISATDYSQTFEGDFDGNGKVISNLTINRSGTEGNYQGLFGYTNSATIKNLGIENCNITGDSCVGGLVGHHNGFSIKNCYITGNVSGTDYVGGLVGEHGGFASTENCHATGVVTGNNCVGGLVGSNYYFSTIENCYTVSDVAGNNRVGGLAGFNSISATIANCYTTGDVTGNAWVGGVAGHNYNLSTISNCYVFSCNIKAATETGIGRIAGNSEFGPLADNHAHNQMKLWAFGSPINILTPTPAHNNIHGADISFANAIIPANYPSAWFTGASPAWTFTYSPNYNVASGTNLPILTAFTKTAFPNTVQSPKIKQCTINAAFYANNVHCDTLFKVTFCDKNVYFRAEVEGEWESIKWFFGGIEDEAGQNLLQWSKTFEPGEHLNIPVKVEVLFANNETVIIEGTLNVRVFWTKIKNIRH